MATKPFNLRCAMGLPVSPPIGEEQNEQSNVPEFATTSEFVQWLNAPEQSQDVRNTLNRLLSMPGLSNKTYTDPDKNQSLQAEDTVKGGISRFYAEDQQKPGGPESREEIARKVFHAIWGGDEMDEGIVPVNYQEDVPVKLNSYNATKTASPDVIKESNDAIRKMAQNAATKLSSPTFNLKTAQHKTLEQVIMYGPDGMGKGDHIDAFTGNEISDWHLVERNKGWGFPVGDRLNLDWEAIWRANIMDKFYRPYRSSDGTWEGGYLEGRFEIDKNIPELNDYQLKPGEKRKPYLPEYGLTEARLEANRTKFNEERGYAPADKGTPFNWKEAQQKKAQQMPQAAKPAAPAPRPVQPQGAPPVNAPSGDPVDKPSLQSEALQLYSKYLGQTPNGGGNGGDPHSKAVEFAARKLMDTHPELQKHQAFALVHNVARDQSDTLSPASAPSSEASRAVAASKKKVASNTWNSRNIKTAHLPEIGKGRRDFMNPKTDGMGEKIKDLSPKRTCPVCGKNCGSDEYTCIKCNVKTNATTKTFAPDKKKEEAGAGGMGFNIPIPTAASHSANGDVYFDGARFVVYAGSKKHHFADYYEARNFNSPIPLRPKPLLKKKKQINPDVDSEEEAPNPEVELSANGLAIDG